MPRVLVVDDELLIRHFLRDALAMDGYDVVAAGDGREAITHLDSGARFDLLITDYSMPGLTGIDVIRHAQHVDPTLPCVIVTAYRDLDLAMRGMQAGAVGYIPKPFKAQHLLTIVASALERRRMAAETARLSMLLPMLERFTMVLANTLESKDCATQHHAERLVTHSDAVSRRLGLDANTSFSIRIGACLHDIGKVGVPEELLRKPGRLTAEEREVMQLHPEIGAAILENIEAWADVRAVVRHHHEHWNGAGYPLGLRGGEIPLGARIVSVVDAFDVMTQGRPYAAARPLQAAIEELIRERGQQFDGEIVDAFIESLAGTADYHGRVNTMSELDVVARRADQARPFLEMVAGKVL